MKTVGLRELKNRLSEYVRQARTGQAVIVTSSAKLLEAERGEDVR